MDVQTKPHEANKFTPLFLQGSLAFFYHPDAQEHESVPSRTIQMVLIKYVNFDLIRLQNPDQTRIMQ